MRHVLFSSTFRVNLLGADIYEIVWHVIFESKMFHVAMLFWKTSVRKLHNAGAIITASRCLWYDLPHPLLVKVNCTLNYASSIEQTPTDCNGYLTPSLWVVMSCVDIYN